MASADVGAGAEDEGRPKGGRIIHTAACIVIGDEVLNGKVGRTLVDLRCRSFKLMDEWVGSRQSIPTRLF